MIPSKRFVSFEDEPFDSFKRRHIERAKIQTSSASVQPPKDRIHEPRPDDVQSIPIPHKRNARATSSARAEWDARLKATFSSEHAFNESEAKTNSNPASHRQLSLQSSLGIRSPDHQRIDTNFKKGNFATEKYGHHEFKKFSWKETKKTPVDEDKSKCSEKHTRNARELNQRQCFDELLRAAEKNPLTAAQTDPKHLRESNPTKHQEIDLWSRKKCKNMVPLSTLLISPKEYFHLSLLPPVAFEREERYNWGHIKRNQFIRNNIIRHQIRVLQMSSQAPIPSFQVQKHSTQYRTQKKMENTQDQPKVSYKLRWNSRLKPMVQTSGEKNGRSSPRIQNPNQKRMALESESRNSLPPIQSHYFDCSHKDNLNHLGNNQCNDQPEDETTSISRPKIQSVTQPVIKDKDQEAIELDKEIHQENGNTSPGAHSPLITNSSTSLQHVEAVTSNERPISSPVVFELVHENQESPEKSARQAKHEKSEGINSYRNASKENIKQASIEEISTQNQPCIIEDEGNSPIIQDETIKLKEESAASYEVGQDELFHHSYPDSEAQVVLSSKSYLASKLQNIPSPKLILKPSESINGLSDSMELFSPSLHPNQILIERKESNQVRENSELMSNLDFCQNSPGNDTKVLVPDTPSTSNPSSILSSEDSRREASNLEGLDMDLEDSAQVQEGSCQKFIQTESNYEELDPSMGNFERLRQAQRLHVDDDKSSNYTSIHETSDSRWEGTEMFEENSNFAPDPSQRSMPRFQKGLSRLRKSESNMNKKIVAERFIFQNTNYRRRGFDFLPSYFSTR